MTTSATLGKRPFLRVEIRRVPLLRSIEWLRRGWEDLRQLGWASMAHGALIAIVGAVLLMLGSTHLYLIAAAVTGYLLVGPIMTTGACELSRRRAAREPLGFDESLQGVTRNPESLMQFGAVLAAIAIAWFLVSAVILQSVLHAPTPTLAVALWGGMTEPVNRSQILAYVGSGAVLAAIVFTLSVVAVPLTGFRAWTVTLPFVVVRLIPFPALKLTVRDGAVVTSDLRDAPIDLMVKQNNGATYLFTVGMRNLSTTSAMARNSPALVTPPHMRGTTE